MLSIEFEDTGSEETTEGIAKLLGDVQGSDALAKLSLVIPGGQIIDGAREESEEERYISRLF